MKFNSIADNPTKLLAMTGYTLIEFISLLTYFKLGLSASKLTLEGEKRQNRATTYKNSPFPTNEDKLFFILVYFKQYTTQSMLGSAFGISQPKANQWIHFLSPVLSSALSKAEVAPCRDMKDLPALDASIFSHDGTERPIQRPKDNDKQKKYYSGKKKEHTVKNNIIANAECAVIFLSDTVEGKKHDKTLADASNYALPEGSVLLQDTGFQGFNPEGIHVLQPQKKPKGKELTQEEKDTNYEISKTRVRVEHVISGIKRLRIVKDKCRNWLKDFKDKIMEIACGLHNFRLKFRPWKKMEITT
jgi:hypothetical protein